ncbi:MAG: hypothetical protein ACREM8_06805 [Vulcanimicrobiaceae bacterium]
MRLVVDLLHLARVDTATSPLRTQAQALAPILDHVARAYAGRADSAGVSLSTGGPIEVLVAADADQLERAVANLVENAVRNTCAAATVRNAATARAG